MFRSDREFVLGFFLFWFFVFSLCSCALRDAAHGAHHGVTITFTFSTTLYFLFHGAGSGPERTEIIITALIIVKSCGRNRRITLRGNFSLKLQIYKPNSVWNGDPNFPAFESRSALRRRGHFHQVSSAMLFHFSQVSDALLGAERSEYSGRNQAGI